MMEPDHPLAVLIVSYRRADLLERCLDSVQTFLPGHPVHVWDNGSSGTPQVRELADRRPDVSWTFSDLNVGYIAAANGLARRVPGHDMLMLNPDAQLLGPLTAARAALSEPGVAVVSPTVEDPTGRTRPWDVAHRHQSVLRALVNRAGYADRLRGRALSDLYATPPREVDGYITGCCLLFRRTAWEAVGEFDERFFVYGEDLVWQRAARRRGLALRLVDDADGLQVRHAGHGTTSGDPLAAQRGLDLLQTARTSALAAGKPRGPSALFAAGSLVLDRIQRSRRRDRVRLMQAQRDRAGGLPTVLLTSNLLFHGGAERQRVLLANELVERGHPVVLVCLQETGPLVAELDPRVRLVLTPWWQPVVDLPTEDAVLVTGATNTEAGFALGWRSGRPHRRWLVASHDPAVSDGPTYGRGLAGAVRAADALIALSSRHDQDLRRHHHLNDTVLVAPNGVPPRIQRSFSSEGPLRLGMLTRVIEYKNPGLLVDALAPLADRDWTLDIFGDGADRDRLEAATPEEIRDRVRWRGWSPGADHAFAEIDVLCVPSRFEAFPLVIVEAMARGLPVVASAHGSMPDILDDGAAGVVVDPITREAWTAALERLLDEPAELAVLAKAGWERARHRYTVSAMTDDYQAAFSHVLGRPVPGARPSGATVLGDR